jgi:hypothetical protein
MDARMISALFEVTQDGVLIVNEKALQNAADANDLAGILPGGFPSGAILWGD